LTLTCLGAERRVCTKAPRCCACQCPRGHCRGWGLSSAPLGAPNTTPANCTRQSCCACPHPTPEQEHSAARRHAKTTMHANHAPRAHTARWKAPTKLRLMEQLRALEAYKITEKSLRAPKYASLRMSGYVRCRTDYLRCLAVSYGLLAVPYKLLAVECDILTALYGTARASVRSSYGARTEPGPYDRTRHTER